MEEERILGDIGEYRIGGFYIFYIIVQLLTTATATTRTRRTTNNINHQKQEIHRKTNNLLLGNRVFKWKTGKRTGKKTETKRIEAFN